MINHLIESIKQDVYFPETSDPLDRICVWIDVYTNIAYDNNCEICIGDGLAELDLRTDKDNCGFLYGDDYYIQFSSNKFTWSQHFAYVLFEFELNKIE